MGEMNYYAGIDLGGSHIRLGLLSNDRIIAVREFPVRASLGLLSCIEDIDNAISDMMGQTGAADLKGIGISFPGLVDVKTKRVVSTYGKYDDAKDFDFVSWAEEKWHADVFLDNDARMAAVGEWKYGAGLGYNNLVMFTLGTGIGTSAVVEGQILRGKHFQAGCLGGHIIVRSSDGLECSCGGRGCVESQAGSWSVDRQAKSSPEFKDSLLNAFSQIGYKELFQASDRGDKLASDILESALDAISAGAVSLIHAYDPEIVILGGSVMKSKEKILGHVRRYVSEFAIGDWGNVVVEPSQLMDDAAIMGVNYCIQYE